MWTGNGSWRRQTGMILGAVLAGPMLAAGLAGPVLAECNPPGADVSFSRTAPYAQRILVGRVADSQPDPDGQGPAQDGVTFTLEVEQVLRGPSTAELAVDHLETGGCIRWLSAADGDVIALAFETQGDHPTLASATAAWIEGRPRITDPYEVMTMPEVVGVAAQPRPPDTATDAVDRAAESVSPLGLALGVVGSLAVLLVTGRRMATRDARRPH